MRPLRDTPFDPFGNSRLECALVGEYRDLVEKALVRSPETHERAVRLAGLPDGMRDHEEVESASVKRFRAEARALGP